jgi:hypothetical protein
MTSKQPQPARQPTRTTTHGNVEVEVWAERHAEPDVDRFVSVLVTLALRRVEAEQQGREADRD